MSLAMFIYSLKLHAQSCPLPMPVYSHLGHSTDLGRISLLTLMPEISFIHLELRRVMLPQILPGISRQIPSTNVSNLDFLLRGAASQRIQASPVYSSSYDKLVYPQPAHLHRLYPFYTPGGADRRWLEEEEEGLKWVGPLMYSALCHIIYAL